MDNQEIQTILKGIVHLKPYYNVATSGGGVPWNTPVWAARDRDFNIYWSSWVEAAHSKNIAANPRAFLTLFDSTRERGTNNFKCLYLDCVVGEVKGVEEARMAAALLYPDEPVNLPDFLAPGLKRFYKASVQRAWVNCLSERQLTPETTKMRQEVSLEQLRAAI